MRKEMLLFLLLLGLSMNLVSAGWLDDFLNNPSLSPCTQGETRCNPSSETIQKCLPNAMTGQLSWLDYRFCIPPGTCEVNASGVAECIGEPECTPEYGKVCYGNDVRWYDSCNNIGAIFQACSENQICANAQCYGSENCQAHSQKTCFGGNVHWADSCGNIEDQFQPCTQGCSNGVCLENTNPPTQTCEQQHAGYNCYGGTELRWYNICNGIDTITSDVYLPCQYGCINGETVCNPVPGDAGSPQQSQGGVVDLTDGLVSLWNEYGFFSEHSSSFTLSNGHSSEEETLFNEYYTFELIAASDTDATIRVTDSSGNSNSKVIQEGQSKFMLDVKVTVLAADENNPSISAYIKVKKARTRDMVDSNDGILVNGISLQEGLANFNAAFSFDGIDDYIQVPDADNLDVSSITLLAWIKPDAVNGLRRIVSKGYAYSLYISNGKLRCSFGLTYGSYNVEHHVLTANDINQGNWYHVGCTYNAQTGTIQTWINGESDTISRAPAELRSTNSDLLIGAINFDSGNQDFFDGLIDEVSIYNRALSYQELNLIYVDELTKTQCTSHTGRVCFNGDIYWKNSCNVREGIIKNCSYGCSAGTMDCVPNPNQATPATPTTQGENRRDSCYRNAGQTCYGGELRWYDWCNGEKEYAGRVQPGCKEIELCSNNQHEIGRCLCTPEGKREGNEYCGEDFKGHAQKAGGLSCEENYECFSNNCANSQCTNVGILDGLLRWLQGLFD